MAGIREYGVVMVGETGKGKSSTGNTILRRRAFKSSDTANSVTIMLDSAMSMRDEKPITVTDTPGLENYDYDLHDTQNQLSIIAQTIYLSPQGCMAILFVKKYGDRWTPSETNCINMLKNIFGPDCMQRFGVIIFTHGDLFHQRYHGNKRFQDWVVENSDSRLGELIAECSNRYVLFENDEGDLEQEPSCVTDLFNLINTINTQNMGYLRLFEEANAFRVQRFPQVDPRVQRAVGYFLSLIDRYLIREHEFFINIIKTAEYLERVVRNMGSSSQVEKLRTHVLQITSELSNLTSYDAAGKRRMFLEIKSTLNKIKNLSLWQKCEEFIRNIINYIVELCKKIRGNIKTCLPISSM